MIDRNFDIERSDVVKTDRSRHSLYVYFEDEPGRRTAAKLLTRDEGPAGRRQHRQAAVLSKEGVR